MRFKTFLEEGPVDESVEVGITSQRQAIADSLKSDIRPWSNVDVFWRGFNTKQRFASSSAFLMIKNDRDGMVFKGNWEPVVKDVLGKLNFSNPVFVSSDRKKAQFFGRPYVVVPVKPFTIDSQFVGVFVQ